MIPLPWRHSFAKARAALSHDDAASAKPILDEIASALPDDLEVQLYAAWARSRVAESTSELQLAALEGLARRALGAGKSLALPLCILGHAALRRDELCVARRLFRRASEADPVLIDARRGLRVAEHRLAGQRQAGTTTTTRLKLSVLRAIHAPRLVLTIVLVLAGVAAVVVESGT